MADVLAGDPEQRGDGGLVLIKKEIAQGLLDPDGARCSSSSSVADGRRRGFVNLLREDGLSTCFQRR